MKYPIVFYDDECPFCQRFKIGLERLDTEGTIHYISIHDPALSQLFPQLTYDELSMTVHLMDEQQKILKGVEVIEYLVGRLPTVNKLAWLLETNVGQKSLDFFYNSVNKLRKIVEPQCTPCKKTG